ncbi:MAG TPA: hypothetical protein VGG33_20340, partial [Polyangia bacterium]
MARPGTVGIRAASRDGVLTRSLLEALGVRAIVLPDCEAMLAAVADPDCAALVIDEEIVARGDAGRLLT